MTTPANDKGAKQRDALEESEKKASQKQPGSFKEKETQDKVVEIPPVREDGSSIKGIDPKK